MILDARHIYGVGDENLEAHWDKWLAEKGLERNKIIGEVPAYISENRWVADCPECNGGMGAFIDRGTACCLDCGTEVTVKFPATKERNKALEALERRRPRDRHWFPHKGEKAAQLERENVLMGHRLGDPLVVVEP